MKIDSRYNKLVSLYRRFLKEIGRYTNFDFYSKTLEYLLEPDEFGDGHYNYFLPFNRFTWLETEEGGLYWYRQCIKWAIFVIDTMKTDDDMIFDLYGGDYCALMTDVEILLRDFFENYELDDETMKYHKKLEKISFDINWEKATHGNE